ncbi:hypothetical protein GCM10011428_36250 [Streptomyces violaceus]
MTGLSALFSGAVAHFLVVGLYSRTFIAGTAGFGFFLAGGGGAAPPPPCPAPASDSCGVGDGGGGGAEVRDGVGVGDGARVLPAPTGDASALVVTEGL